MTANNIDGISDNCARVTVCASESCIERVQVLLNQRVEYRSQYCRDSNFDRFWRAFQFVGLGEKVTNDPHLLLYLVDSNDCALDAFIAQRSPLGEEQIGVFLIYVGAGEISLYRSDRLSEVLSNKGFVPIFVFGEYGSEAANELFLALWSITGPILMPGLIGVDFEDISITIQQQGCVGFYGHGSASGSGRAIIATEQALSKCQNAAGSGFDPAVSCLTTVLSDVILKLDEYNTAGEILFEKFNGSKVDIVIPAVIDSWLGERLDIGLFVFYRSEYIFERWGFLKMNNYVDSDDRLSAIKSEINAKNDELRSLLNIMDVAYSNSLYKFYSQSFKVYHLQDCTLQAHNLFKSIAGVASLQLHEGFEQIITEGTGSTFDMSHNADWLTHTRPIVEAFLHAKYMVEMMIRLNTAEPGSLRHVQAYKAVMVLFRMSEQG